MRPPRPWRRKSCKGAWYACVHGKAIRLAPKEATEAEAWKVLSTYKSMTPDEYTRSNIRVRDLLNLFLAAVERDKTPGTLHNYKRYLKTFIDPCGELPASRVKPLHVSQWLASYKGWGPSTQRGAIAVIKRAFRWGWEQGYLREDPIARVQKPPPKTRERLPSENEIRAVIELWDKDHPFREFLEVLYWTGARPCEVAELRASHIDFEQGCAILPKHKTVTKVQRPRIIYLTTEMLERMRRLAEWRPHGPLLLNTRGNPWHRHAMASQFGRMRKSGKIGKHMCPYLLRHGFATRALENGVPIATVAELLGHTSTQMVSRTYSHLHERRGHLREAVEKTAPQAK